MAGAAVPLLLRMARAAPAAALDGVDVLARSTWGADLPPKGPLSEEAPGDVRFLLVHHTASSNAYAQADVPRLLRSIYEFHTGSAKGWPDIAYNFLVDRFGRVWEGRTGSLQGPVKPDATGGSQGFTQLGCFLGDHTSEPPTAAAQVAMGRLLAALAARYGIDLTDGATATFVSRGSNRHPAGTVVTTPTISGHRDMSLTTCPGDACYPLIRTFVPALAPCTIGTTGSSPPPEAVWATPAGQPTYVALTPARLLDTRTGAATVDGLSSGGGSVGPCGVRTVKVTGRAGVPAAGVGAVVLTVTATAPTNPGFLTVFPAGEARPNASTLNFGRGQTIANTVIAKVGAGGQVSIHNDTGSTHVIVDIAGWFPSGSAYNALSPGRLLDTRSGGSTVDGASAGEGAVGPQATRTLPISGRGGVPAAGAGAVVLNLTATGPTSGGFLAVHPAGEGLPNASNVNFGTGQTIANLVIAKLGAGGQVSIFNAIGSTHVIADVAGWLPAGSDYRALSPARLLDTRAGGSTVDGDSAGTGAVGPAATRTLTVADRGGVPPAGAAAVVLNIAATGPTAGGFLTVHPTGSALPNASNLNFAPGQTVAALVVAKVGAAGQVSIFNAFGSTHVIADVAGWFPTSPA